MPLSEHEQRLLDQIERSLYADDPKFATSVSGADLGTHHRRRVFRSAAIFVLGLILLFAGVITKQTALGVIGFVVMLGSLLLVLSSWQRMSGQRESRAPKKRGAARPANKSGAMNKLEERWRRRWEERGGPERPSH
ncbi:MAG: DUF3040 domain-containing protein [Actinomycetota bacterium]|nr:DUF3040 domain-containing protein [Actinomycetota bacterium]